MNYVRITILFLTMIVVVNGNEFRRIYDTIFKDYKPAVQPIRNVSIPMKIEVSIGIIAIRKVDETTETMTSSFYFLLSWVDEFLQWNPADYGGVKRIVIPASDVWIPDVMICNSLNFERSLLTAEGYKLEVEYTGRIRWYEGSATETHCRMDITAFPFDTQTCSIHLVQVCNSDEYIELVPLNKTDVTMYERSGTWKFNNASVRKIFYGEDGFYYQMMKFDISITRRPSFYVMSVILPVCLLTILNVGVFYIPPYAGERISMCVSVLLSYSVLLTTVSAELPEISSNISILSVFVSSMLCVTVFTAFASVAVVNICHRPDSIPINKLFRICTRLPSNLKTDGTGKEQQAYGSSSSDTKFSNTSWKDVALGLDRLMFYLVCLLDVFISFFCVVYLATASETKQDINTYNKPVYV